MLTPKQERFCQEYVIDLNATQAAIRSGYSKKTATSIGQENLTKLDIAARVKGLQMEIAKEQRVTQGRVVAELAKLAFTDLSDVVEMDGDTPRIREFSELDESKLGAIAEISETRQGRKIKMHDKKGALDSLARHLGMFNDRMEHTGAEGGPIETKFYVEFVSIPKKEK